MKPYTLLIILLCVWGLTNFWLVPLTSKRWQASTLRQQAARAGVLAALEKVRDLSVVGLITLALVMLLVGIAGITASSSGSSAAMIAAFASTYSVAKAWSEDYSLAIGTLALLGAIISLYLCARGARRRVIEVWEARTNEVLEDFKKGPETINAAANDPQLRPFVEQLRTAIGEFHVLREQPGTKPEELQAKHARISQLFHFLAMEIAAKGFNVEEVLKQPSEEPTDAPPTWWRRMLRMLASERLAKDLGLVRKPLSYVLTALIVINLLGWVAAPMANSMQLAVNNLRVNALAQQAQRDLDQALSVRDLEPAPQVQEAPEISEDEVEHVTQMLTNVAMSELLRTSLSGESIQTRDATINNSRFVRAAIVGDTLEVANDADFVQKIRAETAEAVNQAGDAVATDADTATRSALEQEIRPTVEKLRRNNPGVFTRLAQRYAAPMGVVDAQGKLMSEILGQAFGAVGGESSTEVGRQAKGVVKEIGKKAAETFAKSKANQYVAEAILESARPELAERLRANRGKSDFSFATSSWVDGLNQQLRDASVANDGWVSSKAANMERSVATGVRTAAVNAHRRLPRPDTLTQEAFDRVAVQRTQSLVDYDSLFPTELGNAGGNVPADGMPPSASAPSHSRSGGRARGGPSSNFHQAKASFRIRGVVIGRDLDGPGISVRDLRWKIIPAASKASPTQVGIDAFFDGSWKHLGTFDAAVVNQGIRYAADRRVIAATIVPGDGVLVARMTNVHPALVDTPLGCRIIESDRFIDTMSTVPPVPTGTRELSSDRLQMWDWIGVVEAGELAASLRGRTEEECMELVTRFARRPLKTVRFSPALEADFRAFVLNLDSKGDASASFVTGTDTCASGPASKMTSCLCTQVKTSGLPTSYWFPEDHTSQVRERETTITPDLKWLAPSPDRMGNLDFWVHTTFSQRSANDPGASGAEDTAAAFDFPPAQLAALRSVLANTVPKYLTNRGDRMAGARSYEDFMAPIEEFILVQRFARAALDGGLGDRFPSMKLIQLERQTRPFVPRQSTLRWDPTDEAEFAKALREADPRAAKLQAAWAADMEKRRASGLPLCDRASK